MSAQIYDSGNTLGTVEAKVRSIAMRLGDGIAYRFMDWAQTNVELDHIDCPTVVYVLPPSGTLTFKWNEAKDAPSTQLAFLCTTDYDFEGSLNDGIIEAMKRLAIRFIRLFNESGLFEPIEGDVPYQVLYDHLDQNVTGVVLTLTLEEIRGISLCGPGGRKPPPPPPAEDEDDSGGPFDNTFDRTFDRTAGTDESGTDEES